jgi:hypothetical protein
MNALAQGANLWRAGADPSWSGTRAVPRPGLRCLYLALSRDMGSCSCQVAAVVLRRHKCGTPHVQLEQWGGGGKGGQGVQAARPHVLAILNLCGQHSYGGHAGPQQAAHPPFP